MRLHGLIIDPQEDFCNPNGTLFVPGAETDMARLAAMVRRLGSRITNLHVTLDSHHTLDIAHPIWWQDAEGGHPAPFTIITPDDLAAGRWQAADPASRDRSEAYVRHLAANGRYPLCIWPYHCLIGSAGHAVVPDLFGALREWEAARFLRSTSSPRAATSGPSTTVRSGPMSPIPPTRRHFSTNRSFSHFGTQT
jgi:nicotinamidase-related amidase